MDQYINTVCSMEVPTICKAYFLGLNLRGYTRKYGLKYGTFTYLHFRILELPLTLTCQIPRGYVSKGDLLPPGTLMRAA